jgi:two-component system NarL family sensor kinase
VSQSARAEVAPRVVIALLRAALVIVIFVTEHLIDQRQLSDSGFDAILLLAAVYAVVVCVLAARGLESPWLRRSEPVFDVLLLATLAYTSGGAFSDVRKAFFVIPLAAAFSEDHRTTAQWSFVAVAVFTVQAVVAGGHPAGVVNTWNRLTLDQDLYLSWTGAAATVLALALSRKSAEIQALAESRRGLVTQAIESVERERTRLAGALHDSPVQNLIAARHELRRAERGGERESFARVHEALDETVAELREEIFRLHPHVLDHVGLAAALEQVAKRHMRDSDVRISLAVEPEHAEEDPDRRQVLFSLARELIANAAKHSGAPHIWVRVVEDRDAVTLVVGDDGCGIAPGRMQQALLAGHIGLAEIRERVEALGGTLGIVTGPREGTEVRALLPNRGGLEAGPERGSLVRVT